MNLNEYIGNESINYKEIKGVYSTDYSYFSCSLPLSTKIDIKVMLRDSTLSLWSDMKGI